MSKGKRLTYLIIMLISILIVIIFMSLIIWLIIPVFRGPNLDVNYKVRNPLMGAIYKMYGDAESDMWVVKTTIKNNGADPVYNLHIAYEIEGFTDWGGEETYDEIVPGETVRDFYYPTLPSSIGELTTKKAVNVYVKYDYEDINKGKHDVKTTEQSEILAKNTFILSSLPKEERLTFFDAHDNDYLLAAWVTPNEPILKEFAVRVTGGLAAGASDKEALAAAVYSYLAMSDLGVKYISAVPDFWQGGAQYIQYPYETLERKGGTCVELSICLASMWEAVGMRSYLFCTTDHVLPILELPKSGSMIAFESTLVDLTRDYDKVISEGNSYVKSKLKTGKYNLICPEDEWARGVVPPW